MEEKTPPRVSLRQIEGFQFEVRFGEGMSPLLTDEPPPLGKGTGPAPTHLLLAAVGNCMASSLYFALTKFKNDPQGVRAEASAEMGRNEAGRLRVRRIHAAPGNRGARRLLAAPGPDPGANSRNSASSARAWPPASRWC